MHVCVCACVYVCVHVCMCVQECVYLGGGTELQSRRLHSLEKYDQKETCGNTAQGLSGQKMSKTLIIFLV
jgi:hypothetical protein